MELRSLEEALRGRIGEKLEALGTGVSAKEVQAAAAMLLAERGQLRLARNAVVSSSQFDDMERQALGSWLESFGSFRRRRRTEIAMRRTVEENPDSVLPRLSRARLLISIYRPREAVEELEGVLELAPGSCIARSLLAICCTRLRAMPKAEAAMAEALQSCSDSALVRQAEMVVRLRQRDLGVATDAYRARASLLDIRSFPRVFRLWAAAGWAVFAVFAITALAGMWFGHPLLVAIGSGVMFLEAMWEFNIHRSWRRTGLAVVVALLPWVPLMAWR